jgi:drug/metabolite transporter (DMT)-like permease
MNMLISKPAKSHFSGGFFIALVSSAILSTTGIFVRYLTTNYQMPALVLALWRAIFVTLTLMVVLGVGKRRLLSLSRGQLGYLIIYGLVLAVFNSIWTLSVSINGAAVATVLVYCSAAFTAILGRIFLQENLGWVKILAIVLCLAGCYLTAGAYDPSVWNSNLVGIATGVVSGLAYAIYSLMGRSAAQRGLNPWSTLLFAFLFAAGFLLLANLTIGPFLPGGAQKPADIFWLGGAIKGWAIIFALAAGPTVIGFGMYLVSLSRLPSSVANLIVTSEPVFTSVFAFFILGEVLTGIQIGGAVLILGGGLFLQMFEGRQSRKAGQLESGQVNP